MTDIFENQTLTPPKRNLGGDAMSNGQASHTERINRYNKLNRTQDMRPSHMFLSETANNDFKNSVFAQQLPVMTTAEAERWKEYNSYESRDHNTKTKERLREQFNSNTWEIALKREAEMHARSRSNGLSQTQKNFSWKVPEIEQINRHFNENQRFFNTHKVQRKHGLKFVSKPVTDTVAELIEEQMASEIKNPNYLLNPRYTNEMLDSRYGNEKHARNLTQQKVRTQSNDDGFLNPHGPRQKSSVFKPAPYYELVAGMKNSVTNMKNPLYMDKEGNKIQYMPSGKHKSNSSKMFRSQYSNNPATGGLNSIFPRRKRFNEDVNEEIESQRSQSRGNAIGAGYLNSKVLDKANLGDGRSKLGSSKRALTLNRFFAEKSVNTKLSSSLNKQGARVDKSPGYIRRMVVDSGNPRYAASKHSSFFGGVTTGQHVRNRFKVPVDVQKPVTHAKLDEEIFGQEGKMFNTMHNLQSPQDQMNPEAAYDDGVLRQDELYYDDREGEFFARMKGGSMDAMHDKNLDATTVATSVVYPAIDDAGSSVPTAFYAAKISDYSKRLRKEQAMREHLESKIKRLRREVGDKDGLGHSVLMDQQLKSDKMLKMAHVDQRNCMQSGQNYTTHPQFEYL